jgi:hypothetical protein
VPDFLKCLEFSVENNERVTSLVELKKMLKALNSLEDKD